MVFFRHRSFTFNRRWRPFVFIRWAFVHVCWGRPLVVFWRWPLVFVRRRSNVLERRGGPPSSSCSAFRFHPGVVPLHLCPTGATHRFQPAAAVLRLSLAGAARSLRSAALPLCLVGEARRLRLAEVAFRLRPKGAVLRLHQRAPLGPYPAGVDLVFVRERWCFVVRRRPFELVWRR